MHEEATQATVLRKKGHERRVSAQKRQNVVEALARLLRATGQHSSASAAQRQERRRVTRSARALCTAAMGPEEVRTRACLLQPPKPTLHVKHQHAPSSTKRDGEHVISYS